MTHILTTLTGKRIVVTRAIHQAAPLELLLRERGAVPISYPCIAIRAPADTRALDTHLANLDQYDVVALKSANAVTALSQRLRALNLVPDWSRIEIAAVGPATDAALLSNFNRRADFVPATHTADHLAKTLPIANGSRILMPQSALAAESSAAILRARGARVIDVVAYDAVVGSGGGRCASVDRRKSRRRIDLFQPIGNHLLFAALFYDGGEDTAGRLPRPGDRAQSGGAWVSQCDHASCLYGKRYVRRLGFLFHKPSWQRVTLANAIPTDREVAIRAVRARIIVKLRLVIRDLILF